MPKFRSKPVEIEAVQVNWNNWQQVCELFDNHTPEGSATDTLKLWAYNIPLEQASDPCGEENSGEGYIAFKVMTAHGETAIVRHGDWLVPEEQPGRFYPIKPGVFKQKYSPLNFVGQELSWDEFNNSDRPRG